MDYQKLWGLVSRLVSMTEAGKIVWEATAKSKAFQVSLQNFSVTISEEPNPNPDEESPDYVISVYNKEGKLIESASDIDLRAEEPLLAFRTMKDLYHEARRVAYGVGQALDEMIAELDNKGPLQS